MADDIILLDDETPSALVPKMGEFPVGSAAYYQQLFITDNAVAGGPGEPLDGPVDPFGSDRDESIDRPATGVLLTFEQAWRQKGLALGELRHSLCLAPGEVTQVAVVDWRRDSLQRSAASTTQDEAVAAQSDGSQAMQSVQNAVANELRTGFASTSSSATQEQVAGSGGGLLWSVSGSAAHQSQRGMAASVSTGSRDLSASAAQHVRRRTTEMSQATRSRRATQVREVSERERQQTTTRVVANYNHMHALTMQYYEVLQVYTLETRAVDAQRCVFVPMWVQRLDAGSLSGKPEAIELLRRVLTEFGEKQLVAMLDLFEQDDERRRAGRQGLEDRVDAAVREVERRRQELTDLVRRALDAWPVDGPAAPTIAQLEQFQDRALQFAHSERPIALEAGVLPVVIDRPQLDQLLSLVDPESTGFDNRYWEALSHLGRARFVEREARSELEGMKWAMSRFDRLWPVLQDHELFLNQQMWMRVDEHRWHQALAGRTFPDGEFAGHHLGGLVDPTPIGFFGNYVAFRWDFPRGADKERREFERQYVARDGKGANKDRDVLHATVVLPTEGVFAEAVLGQSNSAEKIDISRFWNWQDSPIPILPPQMSPVGTDSRARDVAQVDARLASAVAKLQADFTGLSDISSEALVAALQAELFPDAGTVAAASAAAGSAGAAAAQGAASAQQATVDLQRNAQDFVVGLANSEVGKIAASAIAAKTGGITAVGGLVNAASANGEAAPIDVTDEEPAPTP